jgi:hypothetical protein
VKIPHANGVVKAIRAVRSATQKSLKALNAGAGQRMAKGDYATAEMLAAKGKEIRDFQSEIEALRKRWREVSGRGDPAAKKATTPLWQYYQPILKAIVQAGGQCRRSEIEPTVERVMATSLQAGDRFAMARGRERWQVMIRRARKPLVAEGWIEADSGKLWQITAAGRRTAEQPMTKDPTAPG